MAMHSFLTEQNGSADHGRDHRIVDVGGGVPMSVILEGEDSTTILMRIEVTTAGIHFEVNHISARCEELHKLKEKAKKGRQ